MPTPKLLPCPFCPDGGKPYTDAYVHGWEIVARVGCNKCGIGFDDYGLTGMGRDAQADADALLPPLVEKWNRRATVMQGACRYSDGEGGCRTFPLVPPSETPCEHVKNPARCKLYKAEGGKA